MLTDLRHLLRNLRRSPTSATAAVLTLALTVGASAAIFAVVEAVLLTPPPFPDPDTLATVSEVPANSPRAEPRPVPYDAFVAWRQRARSLAQLEAYDATNLTLTGLGPAERVSATDVTPNLLAVLGTRAWRGRLFDASDADQPLVVVSHAFWRSKLASDPRAIGRPVMLGGRAHTLVGILPERFTFALNHCDLWRPLSRPTAADGRSSFRVRVLARLAPAVPVSTLRATLDELRPASSPPVRVAVEPLARALAGPATRALGLLAAAAAGALLMAFANLAVLLMVRAIDRRRELTVRRVLGAGGSEIARQLALEAGALITIGLLGGVLLATWLTPFAGRLAIEQFGAVANREVAVSWRGLALVTFIVSLLGAACVSLLAAALSSPRTELGALRGGHTSGPRELHWRRLFVVFEVAVACVLLVTLAAVGRSLQRTLEVHPGFEARGLLTLQVSLPTTTYPTPDRVASFYSSLQDALALRLGPGTAAMVSEIPLTGDRGRRLIRAHPGDVGLEVIERAASPHYFDVLGTPLLAGRSFGARDVATVQTRVVVSESLARELFAGQGAVGRQIQRQVGASSQLAEVIGVVGDVKHRALDEESLPTLYLSAWQAPSRSSIVLVRAAPPEPEAVGIVRAEVARLDSALPVYRVRPMVRVVASSVGLPTRRVLTATFLAFALLALVLSAIGLLGVVAHDVASRRAELALRLALGADPRRIVLRPVHQALVLVGAGLFMGGALSPWVISALGAVVQTAPRDLFSFAAAAAVLLLSGVVAVLPAAWRAAHTDPLAALRGE